MGLWRVLSDLEEDGYRTEFGLYSAEETGAPHQRIRCFILAYRNCEGSQGMLQDFGSQGRETEGRSTARCGEHSGAELGDTQHNGSSAIRNIGEFQGESDGTQKAFEQSEGASKPEAELAHTRWPARPGEEQYEWEEPRTVADRKCERLERQRDNKTEQYRKNEGVQSRTKNGGDKHTGKTQSELGGAVDGLTHRVDPIANRVDRLRLLGNGVVSQTAELAWKSLWRKINEDNNL